MNLQLRRVAVLILLACTSCGGRSPTPVPVKLHPEKAPWPAWAWSHWVWEDEENTQAATLQLVKDYQAHDIPVSAVIIDSPWATCYSSFVFDPQRYPDPKKLVDQLHALGVRVMLWSVSAVNLDCDAYAEGVSKGTFLLDKAGGKPQIASWWKGNGSLIDYLNPAAVAWWHGKLDKVLDLEIDGWKVDGTDAYVGFGTSYSAAAAREVTRAEYAAQYYGDFFDYTRKRLGADRIITGRPIDNYGTGFDSPLAQFAPRDISFAPWVGDQDATFRGIKAALNNMYWSAVSNYVGSGSDVGGFRTEESEPLGRSKEVFIRWAQLGAFSPVFENGGGGEHRPWKFDAETESIYHNLVKRRLQLLDYMREAGGTAFTAGKSVLTFQDQDHYAFLFGSDLFVAPILASGGEVQIKFPAGEWIALDGERRFKGGSTVTLTFKLSEYPAYVRAGSRLARYLWP